MTAFRPEDRDAVAITGIGYTAFTRRSGRSVLSLAVEAALGALHDAGIAPDRLGAVLEFQQGDSPKADELGVAIGAPPDSWYEDLYGGGHLACAIVAKAAMSIACGHAEHVLVFRAMNGRSGMRFGNFIRGRDLGGYRFLSAAGLESTAAVYALLCQRHMHEYGTRPEQLAKVAMTQREHAIRNERAVARTPLGREEYFASRMVATPFRLFDCCQETDGACALVISRSDVASDMRRRPVYVRAVSYSGGSGAQATFDRWPDFTETSSTYVGPELWRSAGCGPNEISFAQLYDSFTWTVLAALEGFGICGKGEGGPYIDDVGIGMTSPIPVNTAGGLLSEGYIHGLNLIVEAVEQLRGTAGPRQVPGAELGLVTATGGVSRGSAMVLRR